MITPRKQVGLVCLIAALLWQCGKDDEDNSPSDDSCAPEFVIHYHTALDHKSSLKEKIRSCDIIEKKFDKVSCRELNNGKRKLIKAIDVNMSCLSARLANIPLPSYSPKPIVVDIPDPASLLPPNIPDASNTAPGTDPSISMDEWQKKHEQQAAEEQRGLQELEVELNNRGVYFVLFNRKKERVRLDRTNSFLAAISSGDDKKYDELKKITDNYIETRNHFKSHYGNLTSSDELQPYINNTPSITHSLAEEVKKIGLENSFVQLRPYFIELTQNGLLIDPMVSLAPDSKTSEPATYPLAPVPKNRGKILQSFKNADFEIETRRISIKWDDQAFLEFLNNLPTKSDPEILLMRAYFTPAAYATIEAVLNADSDTKAEVLRELAMMKAFRSLSFQWQQVLSDSGFTFTSDHLGLIYNNRKNEVACTYSSNSYKHLDPFAAEKKVSLLLAQYRIFAETARERFANNKDMYQQLLSRVEAAEAAFRKNNPYLPFIDN